MYPGDKVSADKEISVSAVLLPGFRNMSETQKHNAPVIKLSSETLDLGTFGDKDDKSGTIIIENNGKSRLDIRSMQMFTTGLKVKLNKSKLRPGEIGKTEDHGLQEAAEERKEQAACADDNQRPGKTKGCYTCKK